MQGMTRKKYATDMIKHHQMAVEMSNALLRYHTGGPLAEFAKKVIEAQSKEITWLKSWLQQNSSID